MGATETSLDDLPTLAHAAPSEAAWRALCTTIDRHFDSRAELLAWPGYAALRDALAPWPVGLRALDATGPEGHGLAHVAAPSAQLATRLAAFEADGAALGASLAAGPALDQLREVSLNSCWNAGPTFAALARMPALVALEVFFGEVSGDGWAALAACALPALRTLRLVGAAPLAALGAARWWAQLHDLAVEEIDLRPEDLLPLAGASAPRLHALALPSTSSAGVPAELLGAASLAGLHRFWLSGPADASGISALRPLKQLEDLSVALANPAAASALAASVAPGLKRLSVSGVLGDAGLAAAAVAFPALEALTAHQCRVGLAGAEALARDAHNLRELTLSFNPIGPRGGRALAPALAQVELLNLRYCQLDAEAIEALAPHLGAVRELHLCGNRIGPRGAAALSRAPFAKLELLRLAGCGIGPAGVTALAASPCLGHLRVLELDLSNTDQELVPDGVRALAASPHLPPAVRESFARWCS